MGLRERVRANVQERQVRRAEEKQVYKAEYNRALAEKRAEHSVAREQNIRERARARATVRAAPTSTKIAGYGSRAIQVGRRLDSGLQSYNKGYKRRQKSSYDPFGFGGGGLFGPTTKPKKKKRTGQVVVNINVGKGTATQRKATRKKKDKNIFAGLM